MESRYTENTEHSRDQHRQNLFSAYKNFIKNLKSDIVFKPGKGKLIRSESGTGYTSGRDWNYHATENVKRRIGFI